MNVIDWNFNVDLSVGNDTWSTSGSFKDVGGSHTIADPLNPWASADFSISAWRDQVYVHPSYSHGGFEVYGNAYGSSMFGPHAVSNIAGYLKFTVPDDPVYLFVDHAGGNYSSAFQLWDLTTANYNVFPGNPWGTLASGHTYMFTFWTHASTYHASSTFLRFNTDATMVPVPGAVLLGMLGLGVAGVKLRKRA
jgi:hypothetical protein